MGAPARARTTPTAPAASSVCTTLRRSGSNATAAAASTANCHVSRSAPVSVMAAPRIAPIAAGPAPSRKARAFSAPAQALEPLPAEQDERERGREGHRGCEQAPAEAVRRVADRGDRRGHGPGRDLAQGHGVEKLRVGHPVIGVHGVGLHQRDDHEAAAVGERSDLERRPAQRAQPSDGGRPRRQRRERPPVRSRAPPRSGAAVQARSGRSRSARVRGRGRRAQRRPRPRRR